MAEKRTNTIGHLLVTMWMAEGTSHIRMMKGWDFTTNTNIKKKSLEKLDTTDPTSLKKHFDRKNTSQLYTASKIHTFYSHVRTI